jgi:hypothetical protein
MELWGWLLKGALDGGKADANVVSIAVRAG